MIEFSGEWDLCKSLIFNANLNYVNYSTVVRSSWQFSTNDNIDFDKVWTKVRDCILNNFAGEPEKGVFSPSVQNTLYKAEKEVLESVPEVSSNYLIEFNCIEYGILKSPPTDRID